MTEQSKSSLVVIGKDGFAYADGVRLGRFIPESRSIAFLDKDRRRCVEKGREAVEVRLSDLANLSPQK